MTSSETPYTILTVPDIYKQKPLDFSTDAQDRVMNITKGLSGSAMFLTQGNSAVGLDVDVLWADKEDYGTRAEFAVKDLDGREFTRLEGAVSNGIWIPMDFNPLYILFQSDEFPNRIIRGFIKGEQWDMRDLHRTPLPADKVLMNA